MSQKVSFNYDSLGDATKGREAREHAKQIQKLLEKSAASVVEIGQRMIAVRAMMAPKMFLVWVASEFGWGPAAATNYMQAARSFGDLDCLKQFQPSAICMLARKNIPTDVVDKAIALARSGEVVSHRGVNEMLNVAGHKSTHKSARVVRNPATSRIIKQAADAAVTIETMSDAVDVFLANIVTIRMQAKERDAMAARFFELAEKIKALPTAAKPPKPKRTANASAVTPPTQRATPVGSEVVTTA